MNKKLFLVVKICSQQENVLSSYSYLDNIAFGLFSTYYF